MLREEHERAESLEDQASRWKNHVALLEANVASLEATVAGLKDELASARAKGARRDVDIVALQRQLYVVCLNREPTTSYINLPLCSFLY
jgi:chromosome segregation ATPase